jgi:hypothetical protein
MAMSARVRRELAKLREMIDYFAEGKRCYFCRKLLIARSNAYGHGDGNASPIANLTIHHIDENHKNNAPENKAPCHESCHKKFHARRILHGYDVTRAMEAFA